jgi:histidyl-tRNA synthetase
MADRQSTKPARGTRDFLPDDVRRREYVVGVVRGVYERYGFEPLETPAFENIETLMGKYGEEGNQLIFKILKRGEHEKTGEADLALRYDLTVPLARVVAEHQNALPALFKRYQIQPVWRADRPARGRFREFFQCDIDATGSTSPIVEAEILGAVSEILTSLGFNDFAIRLNHRRVLTALLEKAGVPMPLHGDALVALDKLDKIGADGVTKEFDARGISAEAGAAALSFFTSCATKAPEAALAHLGAVLDGHEAVGNLSAIVGLAGSTPAAGRIRVDPSLARGLSYYTGAIMETAVPDLAGSLGGGGRYDNLIGMFSGESIPASGISLGLERILVVMGERGMFPASVVSTPADVMVVQWFANRADLYLAFANELRQAGVRVELYPDAPAEDGKKVGDRQFKYASARGIPFVAVIGADELANHTVTVKNMKTGEQKTLPRAETVKWLSN